MSRQSARGIPVLVTRPQADGEAFAATLTARFGTRVLPVISPLLRARNLKPDLPDHDFAAVVFTSAQAVKAVGSLRSRLPDLAWCVGRRTADVAAEAGFTARSADGDAEALISAIAAEPPNGSILYLRGVDTASNILESIRKIGIRAEEAVVYTQDRRSLTPEALRYLIQQSDIIVPLFSPRTAQIFREALPAGTKARLHVAAMSANVARALRDLPHTSFAIAHRPDTPAMLDIVESLLAGLPAP
jgi:uroporphyrinogen-III synthase